MQEREEKVKGIYVCVCVRVCMLNIYTYRFAKVEQTVAANRSLSDIIMRAHKWHHKAIEHPLEFKIKLDPQEIDGYAIKRHESKVYEHRDAVKADCVQGMHIIRERKGKETFISACIGSQALKSTSNEAPV